jgi:hypothetical protein
MTVTANLVSTAQVMSGGTATSAGTPQKTRVTYNGANPTAGDKFYVLITDSSSGTEFQLGAGEITGTAPVFATVYNDQVYLLEGTRAHLSGIGSALLWNDPNEPGTGYIDFSSRMAIAENLKAASHYQGMMAFFTDTYIFIYEISTNVANWKFKQVMANTGTLNANSVQALGEMDVMYLGYTGIRNLRVRDSSLNAYVDDIGSPINKLLRTVLLVNPLGMGACSVIEPLNLRFWMYPGADQYIYVLSKFLSSEITAWSRYGCYYVDDEDEAQFFAPAKMVSYKGQVFIRDTQDILFQYGGTTGRSYDSLCGAIVTTPFFDLGYPANPKEWIGIQAACTNEWLIELLPNTKSETSSIIALDKTGSSFDNGVIPVSLVSTHIKVKMTSKTTAACIFSAVILRYRMQGEL